MVVFTLAVSFDPATLIPAVTARPRSWEQSQLRSAVPPALREGLDRCGAEERRQVLRALRRAAESSGFEAAAQAAASIFESGRVPDAAGVDLLARRAPGAAPVAGGGLAVYDGLAAGR